MYLKYFKRPLDVLLSFFLLVVLLPIILLITVIGFFAMKGNPFFLQKRPGKNEKIFTLIKFRTMTQEKDSLGNLLPDYIRLTKYGNFLRKTSLDELPELINIFMGDMSFIGPRPLLVEYLPLYNEHQKQRHLLAPGLTGLAQIEGRNKLSFEDRFKLDLNYIENVSLKMDAYIFFFTLKIVLTQDGISSETSETMEVFTGSENTNKHKESAK